MSIVNKDSYKADVFNFNVEHNGSLIDLTINNVISWEMPICSVNLWYVGRVENH